MGSWRKLSKKIVFPIFRFKVGGDQACISGGGKCGPRGGMQASFQNGPPPPPAPAGIWESGHVGAGPPLNICTTAIRYVRFLRLEIQIFLNIYSMSGLHLLYSVGYRRPWSSPLKCNFQDWETPIKKKSPAGLEVKSTFVSRPLVRGG